MRLKSGVVSIELHCRDVLRTNSDPVNICPFDTFFKNTLVPINSKLNPNSNDNLHKHCLLAEEFALPFTIQKKFTSNCRFRRSRRHLAGSFSIQYSFAQARKCSCTYYMAGGKDEADWLPKEARWGGALRDETKRLRARLATSAQHCDDHKIKLVCLFKFLSLIYFLAQTNMYI